MGIIVFTINLVVTQTESTARVLFSYTPMVILSLWMQISLGVDAIRLIDPNWDEHRGPLYPSLWYSMFSLYDPHGAPFDL